MRTHRVNFSGVTLTFDPQVILDQWTRGGEPESFADFGGNAQTFYRVLMAWHDSGHFVPGVNLVKYRLRALAGHVEGPFFVGKVVQIQIT